MRPLLSLSREDMLIGLMFTRLGLEGWEWMLRIRKVGRATRPWSESGEEVPGIGHWGTLCSLASYSMCQACSSLKYILFPSCPCVGSGYEKRPDSTCHGH